MPMWGYYSTNMSWWMIFSSVIWIVLAASAVWLLVSWLGRASRKTTPPTPPQSALDILNVRYARGETDTATYHAMREQLEAPVVTAPKSVPDGQ
jgi:uncharacterized membrane protein